MPYLSNNANYLVTIQGGITATRVQANAMAKLRLQIQNKWVNILEAIGLSGDGTGTISNVVNGLQIFSGNNFLPVIATSQVWRGSTGIELTLEFRFDAWDNSVSDVLSPVQNLIQKFAPTRGDSSGGALSDAMSSILGAAKAGALGSQFLHPPGPTPSEYISSGGNPGNTITVQLGNVMMITNLIPVDLSWEFEERFDTSGNPMCAIITCTLMSYTLPAAADLLGFFMNQMQTTNTAATITGGNSTSNPNASPVATPSTGAIGIGAN